MSYEKQPHLNGAYYGPPVPPPPTAYQRPGRGGRGCGCCLLDCLCDCGCCLLSCVFKIIFSILFVIGLIILVFWLIVRPHEVKFYATDASLSQFNFTANDNTLRYNLAVNFTVRNPNRHIGVYYDNVEANAYFDGKRFSTVPSAVGSFYQEHKNTSSFGPIEFKGHSVVMLGSDESSDYNNQKNNGGFDIDVKLYLRVRFKLGLIKTRTLKPKIKCELRNVPLSSDGKSGTKFETKRCHYDL